MNRKLLLTIDGVLNIVLGILLIAFPATLVELLGIPSATSNFYPNILGAVLLGIGIALLIERNNVSGGGVGLGLNGAVAINLCGGLVLGAWLLFGGLILPVRGEIFLWLLVAILVGISLIEVVVSLRKDWAIV